MNAGTSIKVKLINQVNRGIVGHENDQDALFAVLARMPDNPTDEEVTNFKRMAERWYFAIEPKPEWMTWEELYLITQN